MEKFEDGEHEANAHYANYQTTIRREMIAKIMTTEQINELFVDVEPWQNYWYNPFWYPINTMK